MVDNRIRPAVRAPGGDVGVMAGRPNRLRVAGDMGATMQVIGRKMVACSKLYLPGDFPKRLEAQEVKDLARSIHEIGEPINEPVVRKSDGKVLCGLDRIAAHFFLKRDMIAVKLVECSDEEAERITVYENLHRRSSPEERARLVQQAIDFPETIFPRFSSRLSNRGRPKKQKSLAREEVAMRIGISPEAIRKKEYRQKRGISKKAEPIRDLGMKLDPEWKLKVYEAQKIMEEDAAALRRQTNILTRLMTSDEVVVQRPKVQRLLELVAEAADLAKELIPSSLCPACKGLTGVQEQCQFCFESGYVTKGQEPGIRRELWDETVVQVKGEVVAIKSLPGVYEEIGEIRPAEFIREEPDEKWSINDDGDNDPMQMLDMGDPADGGWGF